MKKIHILLWITFFFAFLNYSNADSTVLNVVESFSKSETLPKSEREYYALRYQELFNEDINYEFKWSFISKIFWFDNSKVDENIYSLLNIYYNLEEINPTEKQYKEDVEKIKTINAKLFPNKEYLTIEDNLLLMLFFQAKDGRYLNSFLKTNDIEIQNLILVYLNNFIWKINWINANVYYFQDNIELNGKIADELEKDRFIFVPLNWKEFNDNLKDYDFWVIYWIKSQLSQYGWLEMSIKNLETNIISKKIYDNIHNYTWDINRISLWQKSFISFYKTNKNDLKSRLFNQKYLDIWCESLDIEKNKCNIISLIKRVKLEPWFDDAYSVKDNLDKSIKNSQTYYYDEKTLFRENDNLYDRSELEQSHIFLEELYFIYNKWDKFEDKKLYEEVASLLKTFHYMEYSLFWTPEIYSSYELNSTYIPENLNINYLLDFKYR